MKITFSKTVTYTPEWRNNNASDDPFTAELSLMNVEDLLFLLDHFSEAGVEGETEVADVGVDQLKPILEACGHLLPKYVTITNLLNAETHSPITISEVVEFPFFLNLSAELLMKLAEQSSPNDDDEKNLNAPSDGETSPL